MYNATVQFLQIEIDIEPTDKVERIKERVEEKEGIPPQQQRLIFSGKQMYVYKCYCDSMIYYSCITQRQNSYNL